MQIAQVIIKDRHWFLYKIVLLIMVFYSLNCWLFFEVNSMMMNFIFLGISIPFFMKPSMWNLSRSRKQIAIILVLLKLYVAGIGNINLYIATFIDSLPLLVVVLLHKEYLEDLFDTFQNVLSIILGLGAAFWILHLIGYDFLPSQDIAFGTKEDYGGNLVDQYYFENHYLYLVDKTWFIRPFSDIPSFVRFNSIFLEPGYLAILMMFLLFINKFDLKDHRNKVYLVTLILTLSLAGFIMTILAFIAHKMQYSRKRISILVGIGLSLFVAYSFFSEYNEGKNVINEAIISRLEVDKDKGIAGNNRTSEAMDEQYTSFLASPDVVFGLRKSNMLEFGVGYKAYLLKNGLIGMVLFIVFLLWIARLKNNYRSFVLMALYLLMFARGEGTMFYTAFIMVYLVGVLKSTHEIQLAK